MINPKYSIYRAIEHRQYAPERPVRVVAVSHLVRRDLQQFQHVPRERIHVIPNAIDPERVKVAQPGAVRSAPSATCWGLNPPTWLGCSWATTSLSRA